MSALIEVAVFLVDTIFTLYMILILLRFFFYRVNINFREPIAQVIMRLTNPTLRPLHRFIPAWRRIDFAALLLLFTLMLVKIMLILLLYGELASPFLIFLIAFIRTIYLILQFFTFTIIIGVIASWIIPDYSHGYRSHSFPLDFLYRINELLLGPVRAHLPPFQGIDFSPLVVLIILQVLMILLSA